MEKLVYLVWSEPESDAREPASWLGDRAGRLQAAGARALNVSVANLAEATAGRGIWMGEGAKLGAAVSLWLDCIDDRGPIEAALRETGRIDGYLVTESVPQRCTDRDWKDGERSPGVSHVTWFPRPAHIPEADFFRGWHEEHTPLSFDLHPRRWEYVRNSVARTLTPGSPDLAAIVVERFRSLEDYTDPSRLYGEPEVMERMMAELPNFADVSQMHSVPLSEYILRSL